MKKLLLTKPIAIIRICNRFLLGVICLFPTFTSSLISLYNCTFQFFSFLQLLHWSFYCPLQLQCILILISELYFEKHPMLQRPTLTRPTGYGHWPVPSDTHVTLWHWHGRGMHVGRAGVGVCDRCVRIRAPCQLIQTVITGREGNTVVELFTVFNCPYFLQTMMTKQNRIVVRFQKNRSRLASNGGA